MRFLLLTLLSLLTYASAQAELYIQEKSRSPDGSVLFAINYPPITSHPDTLSQIHDPVVEGCFVEAKTKKRIGDFFYLEGTTAEVDHPGIYPFDNYNVFDYLWSADSTHVAIVQNMRHFGLIYPFRRGGGTFQRLPMPDLAAALEERMAGVAKQSIHTDVSADRWKPDHSLVATIARNARVGDGAAPAEGMTLEGWLEYSLRLTLSFGADGKPIIKGAKLRIGHPKD